MNKSFRHSLGWITSAFKEHLADFASFCRGKLGSQQFGQKCASIGVRYCLRDSHQLRCSYLTASVSSTRCVTAAPLRIDTSETRISAVRKILLLKHSAWSDLREFICLWLWYITGVSVSVTCQVYLSPVSQTDWQDAAAAPAELSPDRGAENFPSRPHGPGGAALTGKVKRLPC